MKDDLVYLRHIIECIRRIEEDTHLGRDAFMASHTLQDAVLHNLQTMAESTQRLSDERKAQRPDIAWRLVAGFRNVLAHNYLGVDLEQVWQIVQEDVPVLKHAVEQISAAGTNPALPNS